MAANAFAPASVVAEDDGSMENGVAHSKPERRALIALAAAGLVLLALSPLMLDLLVEVRYERFVLAALVQCAVYAFAVWLVLRHRFSRAALGFVFIVAVLARAIERSGWDVPFEIADQIRGVEAFDA